jgi:hypothetical protein
VIAPSPLWNGIAVSTESGGRSAEGGFFELSGENSLVERHRDGARRAADVHVAKVGQSPFYVRA